MKTAARISAACQRRSCLNQIQSDLDSLTPRFPQLGDFAAPFEVTDKNRVRSQAKRRIRQAALAPPSCTDIEVSCSIQQLNKLVIAGVVDSVSVGFDDIRGDVVVQLLLRVLDGSEGASDVPLPCRCALSCVTIAEAERAPTVTAARAMVGKSVIVEGSLRGIVAASGGKEYAVPYVSVPRDDLLQFVVVQ